MVEATDATRILIVGTGLIGSSIGLALHASPEFQGRVLGWDPDPAELDAALRVGAIDEAIANREAVLAPGVADIYVLACPVLPILDWLAQLAPVLRPDQLVTDVGSTKQAIWNHANQLFNGPGQACFLPGHPMAGKEAGGAAQAEARLFQGAAWLFTSETTASSAERAASAEPVVHSPLDHRWRSLVRSFGAVVLDLAPDRHDELCAWVSHLPQMLSTALAALLEHRFSSDATGSKALQAIGGRALRETTRLGASPYSMWRDVALTNTEPIAAALLALEQELAHSRESLRTPELRTEFEQANRFRRDTFRG